MSTFGSSRTSPAQEMQAVLFHNCRIEHRAVPVPEPEQGEALLRPRMSGICGTDLELLHGYQDFSGVPGHEFVADILRAPGREDLEGQRAVADINCGCGDCPECLCRGQSHCPHRSVIGIRGRQGAFAEYLTAPVHNLHILPKDMPDRLAVFAEPLAAALRITQQIHITASMRITVLGDGKLGLLTAMALRHTNPDILLIGRHRDKLELFERVGGKTQQIGRDGDDALPEETHATGFELVVEATGNPEGIEQAARMCQPMGTIVLKTTARSSACFPFAGLAVQEQRIIGSRCGDLDLSLHYLRYGLVDPGPLIETVLPWTDITRGTEIAAERGSKKVLLDHLGKASNR
ncbi:MAG: alcohol dehydrogenase catalytic domain-containing protein [Desulfohalobiaceae bacterium]